MAQSVERTLKILENMAGCQTGIGIIELARKVGLPPSTTHRLLSTMVREGFARRDEFTGKYKIGYKVLDLAKGMLESQDLRSISLPYLTELRDKTGETAHLVALDGDTAVCIGSVESFENIRTCSPVGGRNPLHCTAVGKAILAYQPRKKWEALCAQTLTEHTPNTITSTQELEKRLNTIKQMGVAVDDEEYELGVRCIAAPIVDRDGAVRAAVGVSGPSARITDGKRAKFSLLVKDTAARIAQNLGASGSLSLI